MANHPSALKRVRSSNRKKERNQYQHKSTRTFMKKLRSTKSLKQATADLPKVVSMVDKLVKRGIIHQNKANRLKSQLNRHLAKLA
ncbi:MAG: 30S ribosomal protein S20 [Bacteroidota bacterium]